jgi:hypothetical protein
MASSVRSVLDGVMFSTFISKAYAHTIHSIGMPICVFRCLESKLLRGDVQIRTAVVAPSLRNMCKVTAVLLDRETILSQGRFNAAQHN